MCVVQLKQMHKAIQRHKGMTTAPPIHDRAGAAERILKTGITLFKARGYHGTSVRDLAKAVGIEPASVYHHFPSKQDILFDIFDRTMDDLLEGLEQALSGTTRHEERLRAAVRFHVLFHVDRQDEAFISHSELRSLTPSNRRRITVKRDRYEALLRNFLADGQKAGSFEITDVQLTTIAILMMCSGVSDWFTKRGRLSGNAIADAYTDMVLRLLGQSGGPRSGHLSATGEQPITSRARHAPAKRGRARGGRFTEKNAGQAALEEKYEPADLFRLNMKSCGASGSGTT
jgi:AcrR family transcriptional regulator